MKKLSILSNKKSTASPETSNSEINVKPNLLNNKEKISIVFIGSGPVASRSLELLSKNFLIEAVVTKPQPLHHKAPFPVLEIAKQMNFPIHTVSSKAEISQLLATKPFKSMLAVLIDFGILVGLDAINYFPLGIVNSHFSLLPEWRGADPITFSILSGQKKTGVSLMVLDAGLDSGKIIVQKSLQIKSNANSTSLTNELVDLSDQLLREYLPAYSIGSVKPRNQPHPERATYSRKLTKSDGIIDWQKPAIQIEREIRAYINWPKSHTRLLEKDVIITKARAIEKLHLPGDIKVTWDKNYLVIGCGNGSLLVEALQPSGKKQMSAEAFIRGNIRHPGISSLGQGDIDFPYTI